jgi:hypothetical protein
MAYDTGLGGRIEAETADWGLARRNMFGGVCYLDRGNLMCGIYKDFLILRLGIEQSAAALTQPHVSLFDITGRPMKGWVMVAPAGAAGNALVKWLHRARAFTATLPAK